VNDDKLTTSSAKLAEKVVPRAAPTLFCYLASRVLSLKFDDKLTTCSAYLAEKVVPRAAPTLFCCLASHVLSLNV
jgi:hypothetical protein